MGFKKIDATTGTYVKHKSIAPNKAKLNVIAIGLNILPSIPDKDKIGIKTIKIINCPKTAEFIILDALLKVIWSISICCFSFDSPTKLADLLAIWNAINSTIITAPSIIIPKSIAPKLIKLASIPKIFMNEIANNKQSGITDATTNPERQLPNNSTTTKITIKQPRIKFSATVKVVLPTNSLRSKKPLI